jgi:hypothetical protein
VILRGRITGGRETSTVWTALLAETAEEENLAELGLRSMKLFINCAVREKQSFGHYNPFCVS